VSPAASRAGATTRLRVRLRDVSPVVERVLDIPAGSLLPEVHDLLQAALGWTDSHLHQFTTAAGVRFGTKYPDLDDDPDELDEDPVALTTLGDRFTYLYDFGDSWEHDVEVLGPGGPVPGVVDGRGACPPEDVGGTGGYEHFLDALADPGHEEHLSYRQWAGSWSPDFDQAGADLYVRQTVGEVPAGVRLVLDLAADGVKLTPGGRLPRAFVRQVQAARPEWAWSDRPAYVEEDLIPLLALHEGLRRVGLLRMRNGRLTPTRAAGDATQTLRRLRTWFGPPYEFTHLLATDAVALLAARGPALSEHLATRLFPLIGNRWITGDGHRLTERDMLHSLHRLSSDLHGLDQITEGDLVRGQGHQWAPGPSARWVFPRATGLAHYWDTNRSTAEDGVPARA
jgi:hypothetical protein